MFPLNFPVKFSSLIILITLNYLKKALEYFEVFSNFVVSFQINRPSQIKENIEDCSATPISGSEKVSNYIFRYCTSNRQTVRKRAFFNWNSGHETLALVSQFSSKTSFSSGPHPWSKSVGDFWIDSLRRRLDYNCFQSFDGDDVAGAFFLFQQEQRKLRVNRLLQYPASASSEKVEAAQPRWPLFHPFLSFLQAILQLQSLRQKIQKM